MLDLGRKLNLIEAMINADRQQPHATRLGGQLTISTITGASARVEIEENSLWLYIDSSAEKRIDVTQDAVSDIVASIETALTGTQ